MAVTELEGETDRDTYTDRETDKEIVIDRQTQPTKNRRLGAERALSYLSLSPVLESRQTRCVIISECKYHECIIGFHKIN